MIFDSERKVYVEYGNRAEIAMGKTRDNAAHALIGAWETIEDDRRKTYARAMAFFVDPKSANQTCDKRERTYRSLWEIPSPPTQPWKLVGLTSLGRAKHFAKAHRSVESHSERNVESKANEGCRTCGSRSHNQSSCPLAFCDRCGTYGHKDARCGTEDRTIDRRPNPKKRNSVRLFDHRRKMLRDGSSHRCERW